MVHENVSHVREDDIYLMLIDINELFGIQYQDLTPLISMYGSFGGQSNVIFPVSNLKIQSKLSKFK